jgi:hypothetical protein
MGAEGGVVYVSLKKGTHENYTRVLNLIQPFWQFLCRDGMSIWAEDAHSEWEQSNVDIGSPNELVGFYGTDRCDSFTLDDLYSLCEIDDPPSYLGDLYALSFDELDLECRTSPYPVSGKYDEHPLRRLWYEHFQYKTREQVLLALGGIADMIISDWANELNRLLHLDRAVQEETWT